MMLSITGEERFSEIGATSRTLVRRFTDEQDKSTTLRIATKTAQEEDDLLWEKQERERLSTYFKNLAGDRTDAYFHKAEAARQQLDHTCKEFFKGAEPSSFSKMLGLQRKTSRVAANEVLQQYIASDIEELEEVVNNIESTWQKKQSKAFSHLRAFCSTLYEHKLALGLVPSQNDYASSLWGGATLLISAAVNYDDIAETLSEHVANISAKVSVVADLLSIIGTQRMYEVYADIHAQVFIFYRDVIGWYLERKFRRFFKSFNERLKEKYEIAVARIGRSISLLKALSMNAQMAMTQISLMNSEQWRREAHRQRQQPREQTDLAQIGVMMQDLLYVFASSKLIGLANEESRERNQILAPKIEAEPVPQLLLAQTGIVSRATASAKIGLLLPFVIGDEGQSLFKDGRFWTPHVEASPKLVKWMDTHEDQSRLWISSPLNPRGFPSSRAAAMTAVVSAWHAHEPIISHFCERAKTHDTPTGCNPEKVGLIGLLYSLIIQLLQFCIPEDAFETSEEQIRSLDGSDESWEIGLRIFSDLLRATPLLKICVIDNLNVLALSAGMSWCTEFLDVLFGYQETCKHVFRILLTTTGNSRIVSEYFEVDERVFVQRGAQEILRPEI